MLFCDNALFYSSSSGIGYADVLAAVAALQLLLLLLFVAMVMNNT